jgi:hypothetical protein
MAKIVTIETRFVKSDTRTTFGTYDSEPFPVQGDVTYWYTRAVYWKREAERNTGVQKTIFAQDGEDAF